MKSWHAAAGGLCGRCGEALTLNATVLVLELPTVARRLVRCQTCAFNDGELPPAVLDLAPAKTKRDEAFMTKLAALAGSIPVAARDPGEEG